MNATLNGTVNGTGVWLFLTFFFFALSSVGFVWVWLLRAALRAEKLRLQEIEVHHVDLQQEAERRHSDELKRQAELYDRLLNETRLTQESVKNEFSGLAAQILDQQSSRLLNEVQKEVEGVQQEVQKDIQQARIQSGLEVQTRVQVFETQVKELKEQLAGAGQLLSSFERERTETYSRLELHLQRLQEGERRIIQETERLRSALTTSNSVRGRWGEFVLRNILESAGLMAHIDFEEQVSTSSSGAVSSGLSSATGSVNSSDIGQPDFVVQLPQGSRLVIDAKAPFMEELLMTNQGSVEEVTPVSEMAFENDRSMEDISRTKKELARRMRLRIQELSSKEYQKKIADALPYVIMFVPNENIMRLAFDADPGLFQFALDKKVTLASPTTLLPLLLLVSQSWRQAQSSAKALELIQLINQLGDRLELFTQRLGKVQKGLEMATSNWNDAFQKSWMGQQGVVKSLEKIHDLESSFAQIGSNLNSGLNVQAGGGSVLREIEVRVTPVTSSVPAVPAVSAADESQI